MYGKDFNQVIGEFYDMNDTDTRRYILSLDEANQNMVLSNLTSKLYDKIVAKVDDIDFGSIPKSKGDITKIENFEGLVESVNIMRDIIKSYHQSTEAIDVVSTAIDNIRNRERAFSKAFSLGKEYPMLVYNTIVLSIVGSVSFLISSCIEFIKVPNAETYEVALCKTSYKRSMSSTLLKNLKLFNEACNKGDVDKSIEIVMQGNSIKEANVVSKTIGTVAGLGYIFISLLKCILPIIRELVFYFFNVKMKVSDYFAKQAELLEMNSSTIIYKADISQDKKTDIIKKQTKLAERFKKFANFFDIENKKAEKAAIKDSVELENKLKKEDLEAAPLF